MAPEAMAQTSSTFQWLHLYGDFISKNASAVSQIESGLRSLTYIIPGRYRESDVASEAGQYTQHPLYPDILTFSSIQLYQRSIPLP